MKEERWERERERERENWLLKYVGKPIYQKDDKEIDLVIFSLVFFFFIFFLF